MTNITPTQSTDEQPPFHVRPRRAAAAQAEPLPLHSRGTRPLIPESWRRPTPMSEHEEEDDERDIEAHNEQYNARLIRRVDHTDQLATFWVKFDGEPTHFEPGQYMTIGVYANGKLVQRPYSVASPPVSAGADGYEFYVRLLPILRFTTLLWRLPMGHAMRMIGPKGKFLEEPEDKRTHLFVSTGTGIAPFISMMRQDMINKRPRRTIVLHGCSYVDELGYRQLLEGWQRDKAYPLSYVPTISRPDDPRNAGWTGRTGRAESVVLSVCHEFGLRPEKTVVYICGNPDMILGAEAKLMDAGFPEFHVKKELYWPKGKTVQPAAVAG